MIAEEVLFPAALDVDAAEVIPPGHFDRLADEGFYGLVGAAAHGGRDVDVASLAEIVETFSGGCLATTFTWMQHHSVVRALGRTTNVDLAEKYLDAAIRGAVRGGVAFAGAIPRPPRLWATATAGGWLLSGEAPLVTGWGIVDILLISARDTAEFGAHGGGTDGGNVVSVVIDAAAGGGIAVEPLWLLAAQGSNTVRLRFDDYFVPAGHVTAQISHAGFLAHQHISARLNGGLAMGVAGRCIRLIGDAGRPDIADRLRSERDSIRHLLDAGLTAPEQLPAARAAASELAYRAAGTLVVTAGSSGILHRQHAGRLVREATFTLVAAGRPEIKDDLLDLISRTPRVL